MTIWDNPSHQSLLSPELLDYEFFRKGAFTMHIILASASPRRRELIHQIGWTEDVLPSSFPEAETPEEAKTRIFEFPESVQQILSCQKGADLVTLFNACGKAKSIFEAKGAETAIVAADTVVVLDEDILGKPKDEEEARFMLRRLSGRAHEVKTGLSVYHKGHVHLHVETTRVYFRKLSASEIDRYVATGEPMDKAGAYGIQGKGAILVSRIEGSYDNVVGLPLARLYEMMREEE